ncbi:hypothetical protein HYU92_02350 [Candidatus Curtissbacteria bacterium]|nr:hypothetical protein [Candidatus Curtissbacteria bacterium]
MELKQYLAIFKKYSVFILAFAAVGAASAFIVAARLPSGYRLDQLFYLWPAQNQSDNFYNFDGFYAQEKARNFTDTAVAILASPDFLKEVTQPYESIAVRKTAPQLIRITSIGSTPEDTQILMQKTLTSINQKLTSLASPNPQVQLRAISQDKEVTYQAPNKKILIPFGAIIGAILAIFIAGLKTYFKL